MEGKLQRPVGLVCLESVGLWKAISVGSCRGRDDPDPSSVRFPSGGLGHSTIDDICPSNAAVPHLNRVDAPRRRGCVRHPFGSLCRVSLLLFQPRAGICALSSSARACGVAAKNQSAPATTNATAVLDNRRVKMVLLLCRWRRAIATMRPDRSTTPDCFALGNCTQDSTNFMGAKKDFRYRTFPINRKASQQRTIDPCRGLWPARAGRGFAGRGLKRQLLYRRKVMLFATDLAIVFGRHLEQFKPAVRS